VPGRPSTVLLETVGKPRARIHDTLAAANGAPLLPVHPVTAPLHDEALLHPHNVGYTGLFNILGTPATAVPMGLDEETGVPVAIQASSSLLAVTFAWGAQRLIIQCSAACRLSVHAALTSSLWL